MLQHSQALADMVCAEETTLTVLDKGFVRLVRYMGGDATAVQSARVSYGNGTKTMREDVKLLEYLIKHKHWSPFEQIALVFHMKLPIFVARQMVRHRTAKLNEVSARYSEMKPEFWLPQRHEIREQSTKNKQGSDGIAVITDEQYAAWLASAEAAFELYKELLDAGVCREQARSILPVSLYTEWFWQMDLRNLLNFLSLRLDSHAQYEMQEYAKAVSYFSNLVAPETMKIVHEQGLW